MNSLIYSTKLILKHNYLKNLNRNVSSFNIIKSFKQRGVVKECLPEKEEINLELNKPQCLYAGFDPTADSLHLGNLLVITTLIRFLRAGHKVICLIGDATVRIGDPSDKDKERPSISLDDINKNSNEISSLISLIFSNHYKYIWCKEFENKKINEPIILKNNSWYNKLNVVDFFNEIGKNIRLTNLLSKKFVENRIKWQVGLSYSEFSYQVFQAYDWYHLLKIYDCRFQIGGLDQIGNIQEGVSLIYRKNDKKPFGILIPIILDEEGKKYGKSSGQPIWLNKKKLSYFDFYQFILRTKDTEVENLLKLYTFLSDDEINKIMMKHLKKKNENYAQKVLAEQVTLLVHGEEGLKVAKLGTEIFYKKDVKLIEEYDRDFFDQIFLPQQIITMYLEPNETNLLDVLLKCNAFLNESDTIKAFKMGSIYINGIKYTNCEQKITDEFILKNLTTLIRIGKKRFYIIKWQ